MTAMPLYPLQFAPIYQYRLWGGRRLGSLLSAQLPGDEPTGEAWQLSDRDDHPSRVADGPLKGMTIAQLAAQSPDELLGVFAGRLKRFPLLLKLLDVRQCLSVQVYPSDKYQSLIPIGETGKTEAWVVLENGPQARVFAGLRTVTTADRLRRALADGTVVDELAGFTLVQFFGKLKLSASFDALASGAAFTIAPIAEDIAVFAEPQMLAAAVGNLLQNAFKFTRHRTEVRLSGYALNGRVVIDVEDRCGGLPAGAAETMSLPSAQSGQNRSEPGLGLDIAKRSIEANGGVLTVRNVPGTGCIFTINLPRLATT